MNDMLGVLRRTGRLSELDFPDYFARACPSLAVLSEQISRKFAEFTARETMRRKVAQVRGVVTDQFEGMALMIDSISAPPHRVKCLFGEGQGADGFVERVPPGWQLNIWNLSRCFRTGFPAP